MSALTLHDGQDCAYTKSSHKNCNLVLIFQGPHLVVYEIFGAKVSSTTSELRSGKSTSMSIKPRSLNRCLSWATFHVPYMPSHLLKLICSDGGRHRGRQVNTTYLTNRLTATERSNWGASWRARDAVAMRGVPHLFHHPKASPHRYVIDPHPCRVLGCWLVWCFTAPKTPGGCVLEYQEY